MHASYKYTAYNTVLLILYNILYVNLEYIVCIIILRIMYIDADTNISSP